MVSDEGRVLGDVIRRTSTESRAERRASWVRTGGAEERGEVKECSLRGARRFGN